MGRAHPPQQSLVTHQVFAAGRDAWAQMGDLGGIEGQVIGDALALGVTEVFRARSPRRDRFRHAPDAYGVGVAIGSETHTPELLHASVVTSGYGNSPASRTEPAESDAGHEDGGGSALGGTAHANTAQNGMAGSPA